MMTAATPFLFDRCFAPRPAADGKAAATPPATEPRSGDAGRPAVFTEQDLAQARSEGFAEGQDQARLAATEATEERIAAALEAAGKRLAALLESRKEDHALASRDAAAVAVTIARKLVPALYRRDGVAEIEAVVASTLAEMFDKIALTVRVNGSQIDAVEARLRPISEASGFGDLLTVVADPTIAEGDCRIEWEGGGAERKGADLWSEIDAIVERHLGIAGTNPGDDRQSAIGEPADVGGAVPPAVTERPEH